MSNFDDSYRSKDLPSRSESRRDESESRLALKFDFEVDENEENKKKVETIKSVKRVVIRTCTSYHLNGSDAFPEGGHCDRCMKVDDQSKR